MFRITPQSTSFYGLFTSASSHVLGAAEVLRDAMGMDSVERAEAGDRVSAIEREGDMVTREIVQSLRTSFITPFDRGDVHQLASGLDDCLDRIEAAMDVLVLHRIAELPEGVGDQVDAIVLMAELTAGAMPRLRAVGSLDDYWTEVDRLATGAAHTHRRVVAEMLNSKRKAVEVIRVTRFSDALAAVSAAFGSVAGTVEGIAVKES